MPSLRVLPVRLYGHCLVVVLQLVQQRLRGHRLVVVLQLGQQGYPSPSQLRGNLLDGFSPQL